MGNCNQKNKLPIVQGINITPNFKVYESYVNETYVNESYVNRMKQYPKSPEEDPQGNYIWIKLSMNNLSLQKKQEDEGFIITSVKSDMFTLRKKRILNNNYL